MSFLQTLSEHFFYTNKKSYSDKQGNIAYLDSAPLNRPMSLPLRHRAYVAIIVVAAIVAGAIFLNTTVFSSLREIAAAEQAVSDNLAREASIETLPLVQGLMPKDDNALLAWFDKKGYTVYNASEEADSDELILYKLPDDMTLEEAEALYTKGISNLTAPEATRLLNGSWQLVVDRSDTTSMVVRYADFTTGDPQIALQNALQKLKYDADNITDSGTDDSGNTYEIGTVTTKTGRTYSWKISAIPLAEMFSFSNVPDDACYVGVRLTE